MEEGDQSEGIGLGCQGVTLLQKKELQRQSECWLTLSLILTVIVWHFRCQQIKEICHIKTKMTTPRGKKDIEWKAKQLVPA